MRWKYFVIIFYVMTNMCKLRAKADVCTCNEHILCLYPYSLAGKECVGHIRSGFDENEKQKILELMNEYRSRVATGEETLGSPGPQPTAADMMELTWDSYLEKTSQRWADQCTFIHSSSKCRITESDEYFGENLAISWYTPDSLYRDEMTLEQIKAWYDEVKDFPKYLVDDYQPAKQAKKIGHYAQLILGPTSRVGCGRTRYAGTVLLVCHFKPGVYSTRPLYKKGKPTSACPEESFESKYKGLCSLNRSSKMSFSPLIMVFLFLKNFNYL